MTIDATGGHNKIAADIVGNSADYCPAVKVKQNERTLHAGLIDFCDDHPEDNVTRHPARRHEAHEMTHGREDVRSYVICPIPESLPDADRWKNLKAIGVAIKNTMRDGGVSLWMPYYIILRATRERWLKPESGWMMCGIRSV